MTLTTYNFLWGIIKYFLPNYLARRKKNGKKMVSELTKDTGIPEKKDLMVLLFGSMGQALVNQSLH